MRKSPRRTGLFSSSAPARMVLAALSLSALSAVAACVHAPVMEGRISALWEIAKEAEENGAYRCAPEELAKAKSHLHFAEVELAQGDQVRAEEHLILADPNARAALDLSPPSECLDHPKPGDLDGDGILDPDDSCPQRPEDLDGFEDIDGCPDDQDSDGDGLADSADLCISDPEDTDGYLDTDGCPDPDNDGDLIVDADDGCPDEAEDPDGFQDEDGCPDTDNDADTIVDTVDECPNEAGPESENGCPKVYKNVVVTNTHIQITQKVYFKTGKAIIERRSHELLGTVAMVLKDFPSIRVEVQGHTDDRGRDSYNQKLSQKRADSVREYLAGKGIESYRMAAVGYGEARPIDSNRSKSGRAANRRVEFVRTDDAAIKAEQQAAGGDAGSSETPP